LLVEILTKLETSAMSIFRLTKKNGKKIPDRDCEGAAKQKAAVPQAATSSSTSYWALEAVPMAPASCKQ
jgi:hypothetical protein